MAKAGHFGRWLTDKDIDKWQVFVYGRNKTDAAAFHGGRTEYS